MKKYLLTAALTILSSLTYAQLNTTGVKYLANQKTKKVRMVVPDTVQAEKLFQENLNKLQEELAQKQTLLQGAQTLQTKVGKKLKETSDIEMLQKVHEFTHSGLEFKVPKKIAKSMAADITTFAEALQNDIYDVERAIKLGWQGTEYPQKEYSTEIENDYYRGLYVDDNEQLDKFDFEYQIKGYESKLTFDEAGLIQQNDLYDKRGRLIYVASLLRTDTEVMDKIRSTVKTRYKKVDINEALAHCYLIERVTKTSFRVVFLNGKSMKPSYAALVTYRSSKPNKKTCTVTLTIVPKNIPSVIQK